MPGIPTGIMKDLVEKRYYLLRSCHGLHTSTPTRIWPLQCLDKQSIVLTWKGSTNQNWVPVLDLPLAEWVRLSTVVCI